jgi:catechol 2,3-dioxygenase-like lactoylglutathione lyase family enzyme
MQVREEGEEMDYKLELVIVPVSDVDRAKAFYVERAGFDLHVDHSAGEDFRVVQLVPRGSACAIAIGTGISDAAPGSVRGLHLMVTDIVAAREELLGRGVDVGELRHIEAGEWASGPHPQRADYNTFAEFADPDGNIWLLQERGFGAD